ncbi:MAG: methyltransferase domain-containing protein [Candidatus Margulisiibacteriota bacterium]
MSINNCRVCGNKFYAEPLLQQTNMPSAAQYLPDAATLTNDRGVNLELYQCSGCGLVQLNRDPVPYYKEVIRAAAVSAEMKNFRQKQFRAFVKKYSLKGKKMIEIGCGRGEYLSIMQQTGVDAYGLEYAGSAVAQGKETGLNVQQGFVHRQAVKLKGAPFAAFFMLNFLEHLPEPNGTLKGIHNNLSDDGVGLVEVPNFNMMIQKNLFSEFIGDHLFYFTKDTLVITLKLNGFEVLDCAEVWHDYILSAVVKKRNKLNLLGFCKQQTKLKKEINGYLSRYGANGVAVWGAGHQALAVIALTKIARKIKYVVDSAAFKQGKYTPATHVRIVHPDTLSSDPVGSVIVMAASYSDEVAKKLCRQYGRNMKIAILRDHGLEIVT